MTVGSLSRASAAWISDWNARVLRFAGRSKSILSVSRCWKNIGPGCPNMATSENSLERNLSRLTSSAEDSRASQSASLESERLSPMSDGSGLISSESFAWYDPDSCLWRIRQASLLPVSRKTKRVSGSKPADSRWERFSETWPRAGMTRSGIAYRRQPSVLRTCATGSGLWPTLRSTDGERGGRGDLIQAARGNENSHFRMPTLRPCSGKRSSGANRTEMYRAFDALPTLTASEATSPGPRRNPRSGRTLRQAFLPTLTSRDYRSGKNKSCWNNSRPLNELLPTLTSEDSKPMGKVEAAAMDRWMQGETADSKYHRLRTCLPAMTANRWSGLQSHGENAMLGPLNPEWCEWYMGFPIGWTALEPSATP